MRKKEKTKTSLFEKIAITFLSLVIVASIALVGYVYLMNTSFLINKDSEEIGAGHLGEELATPKPIKKKCVNFLVCGIDYAEGSNRGKLTDMIMLVSFDIDARDINVLRIPRDSYIGSDYPTGKINAIYGQRENGGIEGLARRINSQMQLPIDHYITVNMDGFKHIVDAIGGVTVDVPKRIDLEGVVIEKGVQTLDGLKAERFVRVRKIYANGDFGRIEMQNVFMKAMIEKIFSMEKSSIVKLAPSLIKEVTTDLTISEALGFYENLVKVDRASGIHFYTVETASATKDGLSIQSIKEKQLADLLNDHFRPYSQKVSADELSIIELVTDYEYPTPEK